MFNTRPMSKLLVVASKDQLDGIVRELYRHHVFHIEDFVETEEEGYEGVKIGMPLPQASAVSTELLRIRAIVSAFGGAPSDVVPERKESVSALSARIDAELPQIEAEVSELIDRRNHLESAIRECETKISELEPFVPVQVDLSLLRGYEQFSVLAGHIPAKVELPVPAETYFSGDVSGNLLIAIVPNERLNEAEQFLFEAGFQSVPVPGEEGLAKDRIAWYTQEISRLRAEMEKIDELVTARKDRHQAFLVACDELLTAEAERAEAPLRFATTDTTFVAEGWVPSENVEALTAALRSVTNGRVFIAEQDFDPVNDNVPIEFDNPDFSKPTEMLMDVYSRPQYAELDPTLFLAIVFPVFFGFILGDVGYGLVLLALSFGLRRIITGDAGAKLLKVIRNASVSSIIFGLLFSEFLGFALPWEPIGINRHLSIGGEVHGHGPDVVLMLVLSAWAGILHITLGRLIHIRNARRMYKPGKHQNKVVFGQAGWILVMWGILFALWSMFELPLMPSFTGLSPIIAGMNIATLLGAVMLIVGIVAIGQENSLELLELPTVMSHTLSYARLAAVGISSVAIAMVVNYIAIGMMIEPAMQDLSLMGVIFIIAGLIVFLLGHTLNTALGLLGGGLHSIRLHYVEFFTKFYLGRGKKYDPFGMIRKFTED
ncbi:MAG TPA: V-type ATP synthase subunit I [Methanoculleus sp.]|nr:V-type ATP synthase subunit I [Methanoculleus sp.]